MVAHVPPAPIGPDGPDGGRIALREAGPARRGEEDWPYSCPSTYGRVEEISVGGFEGTWDGWTRVAHFRRRPAAGRTIDVARDLAGVIEKWVGSHEPFILLVDATHSDVSTLAWRLEWADVFRRLRSRVRLGVYGLDQALVADLEAFRAQSGIELHLFPTQAEAEAWATRPESGH